MEWFRRKTESARFFDLNIGEVLEHWDVAHAVREIIANALDEALLSQTPDPEIQEVGQREWIIRDWGRGIRPEHFTLDENEEKQANQKGVIGTFGVGLKDGLAVFHRHGVEVEINSRYGTYIPRDVRKHGFEDIQTLHLACLEPPRGFTGTEVRLTNVGADDLEAAMRLFRRFNDETVLENTNAGVILERGFGAARVYLKGVLVAEEERFRFSYDVTSLTPGMKKQLSRERLNVGRTLYTPRVKAMLLEASTEDVLQALMSGLRDDIARPDELTGVDVAARVMKVMHDRERVVFVTYDQAMANIDEVRSAEREGYEIVQLPQHYLHKAEGVRDLHSYSLEALQSHQYTYIKPDDLTSREQSVWSRVGDLLVAAGVDPSTTPPILISETIRTVPGSDARGVFRGATHDIVIKRSTLRSLSEFAGVLLHEIAHARSQATDCTREFESELSNMLGRAAASAIGAGSEPPELTATPAAHVAAKPNYDNLPGRPRALDEAADGITRVVKGRGRGLWHPPPEEAPERSQGRTLEELAKTAGVDVRELIGEAYTQKGLLIARNRPLTQKEEDALRPVVAALRGRRGAS